MPADEQETAASHAQHLAMLADLADLGMELARLAAQRARAEAAGREAATETAAAGSAWAAAVARFDALADAVGDDALDCVGPDCVGPDCGGECHEAALDASVGADPGELAGAGAAFAPGARAARLDPARVDPHLAFSSTARAVCCIIALEARIRTGDVMELGRG